MENENGGLHSSTFLLFNTFDNFRCIMKISTLFAIGLVVYLAVVPKGAAFTFLDSDTPIDWAELTIVQLHGLDPNVFTTVNASMIALIPELVRRILSFHSLASLIFSDKSPNLNLLIVFHNLICTPSSLLGAEEKSGLSTQRPDFAVFSAT